MSIERALIVALALGVGFFFAGRTVYWLFRFLTLGGTDKRTRLDEIEPRVTGFVQLVMGQARVVREFAGMLHFFVFWGFLILQIETLEYFVRGFYEDFRLGMLIGAPAYHGLLLLQDVFGAVVLACVIALAVRRFVVRPEHSIQTTDAAVILAGIGGLMVTKFVAHGAELVAAPHGGAGWDPAYTPVATAVAGLFGGVGSSIDSGSMHLTYNVMYFSHIAIVVFFANYIPLGKHLHLLGAMPNVFFRKLEPSGALYPIDLENENAESFGAGKLEDLSWKQLLDTYACTECARCEHYCPAFNTGKELNPMQIIHKLKDHIKEKGRIVLQEGRKDHEFPVLAGGVISKEELMACTTCGACVANCPVNIEHVDTIVDMRRYIVLTESDVAPEVSRTFKNMERSQNPWGVSNKTRAEWAEGLDIPLVGELEAPPEYLFWVGCAGSFDDRQKKVTQAMARVLKSAGVSFAILGPEESCTGDPARRIGNEYLYHTLASTNVEVLNTYKITKIITTCPHCFHTIGKEYPQLGGHYEVIHHTKLLNILLREGRVKVSSNGTRKYVYHDSCYIGRWNEDYENPREALAQVPGAQVQEMEWNRRKALCCGAGGGRMWMEEHQGKRVNVHRSDMAIAAGGDAVVVNCPFCMTMLTDGLKQRDSELPAYDLAEVVADALAERPKAAAAGLTDAAE
jgi:Fe-S oxidoreductase